MDECVQVEDLNADFFFTPDEWRAFDDRLNDEMSVSSLEIDWDLLVLDDLSNSDQYSSDPKIEMSDGLHNEKSSSNQ